jgi:hypothetical protein
MTQVKPFDLEAALAGASVQTRDGRPVTQLVKFDVPQTEYPLIGTEYPLIGVVDDNVNFWTLDGRFFASSEVSMNDLFMALEKKEAWDAAQWADARQQAEIERLRKALRDVKRLALTMGAPGEIPVSHGLARIVRLSINAGISEHLDELQARAVLTDTKEEQ